MITVNDGGAVACLGIAGEHNFREVAVDAGAWIARFPDGQITAVFQRPDGVAYSIPLKKRGNIVTWHPTESDTVPGLGALELRVHDGERLGKSSVIRTICAHSVDHPIDDSPPGDLPPGAEVGQVLTWSEDGAVWREPMALSEEELKALQNDVSQYVTQARGHMNRAEEYAGSAATSTSNASKFASSAENAKAAAETAKSGAESAKAAAATSETNAAKFATNAASSAMAASNSATAASSSAAAAKTSETNAVSSASSANSSKTAAASSATTAANAANEAKGYRDEVKNMLDNAEVDPANAVLFTEQTLTEAQKSQVRSNIGVLANNQGTANVGKILVVGADGNLTLTDMPEDASGDVIGMIDANNNIVITGNLADGTYIFKYENADGTYANIGSLVVGGVVQYAITANLTNCIGASGNAKVIEENGTVTLTFTANDGYLLPENVTVSGAGYTWNATTGKLVLSKPTADVVITIAATKNGYTNIIDTVGYEDDKRLSSSGVTKDLAGYVATGMIDISDYTDPVTIRTTGVNFNYDASCYIVLYDASGTKLSYNTIPATVSNGETGFNKFVITADDNGNLVITTMDSSAANYLRINGYGSGANLIVTINEEITD